MDDRHTTKVTKEMQLLCMNVHRPTDLWFLTPHSHNPYHVESPEYPTYYSRCQNSKFRQFLVVSLFSGIGKNDRLGRKLTLH